MIGHTVLHHQFLDEQLDWITGQGADQEEGQRYDHESREQSFEQSPQQKEKELRNPAAAAGFTLSASTGNWVASNVVAKGLLLGAAKWEATGLQIPA